MVETVGKIRCKGNTYFCVPSGADIIRAVRKTDLPKGYPIRVARWWKDNEVYDWHWSLSVCAYPTLYDKIEVVERRQKIKESQPHIAQQAQPNIENVG